MAGTTRDAVDVPYERNGTPYLLIDTAGIRKRTRRDTSVEVFSVMRSEKSIRRADVCLLVIDASSGVTTQDRRIAKMVIDENKPCLVILNKFDLYHPDAKYATASTNSARNSATISFSCPTPQGGRVRETAGPPRKIFEALERVLLSASEPVPTGALNRLLQGAIERNPPPMRLGKRLKLLYATQQREDEPARVPVPQYLLFVNYAELLTRPTSAFSKTRSEASSRWRACLSSSRCARGSPRNGAADVPPPRPAIHRPGDPGTGQGTPQTGPPHRKAHLAQGTRKKPREKPWQACRQRTRQRHARAARGPETAQQVNPALGREDRPRQIFKNLLKIFIIILNNSIYCQYRNRRSFFRLHALSPLLPDLSENLGLTLVEVTLVVTVLLGLISIGLQGCRPTRRVPTGPSASTRSPTSRRRCALLPFPGTRIGTTHPDLKKRLIVDSKFFASAPFCPSGGTYVFHEGAVPHVGTLFMRCSIPDHAPKGTSSW